ncbi:MAG: AI-2E family transporter [Proteobacteria bacterium]|nr:AI-2E family transporter [Pseudomonadota bacterium]
MSLPEAAQARERRPEALEEGHGKLVGLAGGEPLRVIIEREPFPWKRVLIGAGVVAALYAVIFVAEHIHQVIVMLAVAALVAFILDPLVVALQKRMPRWAGIVVVYLAFVAVLVLAGVTVVPRLAGQLLSMQENAQQIQSAVHGYIDQVNQYIERVPPQAVEQLHKAQASVNEWANASLRVLFSALISGLGWIGKGMIILVLSIYLLLDKDRIRDGSIALVPAGARDETLAVVGDVLEVLRAYLRGQIVVIGFVAVSVTVVLVAVGMPYALVVGVLAGILEVIPYFGAVVGAVPGVLYSFAVHGFGGGLLMITFFVIINQIEGHVVIPLVMGANLEMRPATVLLSLLVGAELAGIVGLIVAVPVCSIAGVLIEHGLQIYCDLSRPATPAPAAASSASSEEVPPEAAPATEAVADAPPSDPI